MYPCHGCVSEQRPSCAHVAEAAEAQPAGEWPSAQLQHSAEAANLSQICVLLTSSSPSALLVHAPLQLSFLSSQKQPLLPSALFVWCIAFSAWALVSSAHLVSALCV